MVGPLLLYSNSSRYGTNTPFQFPIWQLTSKEKSEKKNEQKHETLKVWGVKFKKEATCKDELHCGVSVFYKFYMISIGFHNGGEVCKDAKESDLFCKRERKLSVYSIHFSSAFGFKHLGRSYDYHVCKGQLWYAQTKFHVCKGQQLPYCRFHLENTYFALMAHTLIKKLALDL